MKTFFLCCFAPTHWHVWHYWPNIFNFSYSFHQQHVQPYRQIDGLAPTFLKKPAIRQEDDGKRLLFECLIKADPLPQVRWSHNGSPVDDGARHKVLYFKPNKINYFIYYFNFICITFSCQFRRMASNILLHLKLKMLPLRMPVNTKWQQKMSWARAMQRLHWTLTVSKINFHMKKCDKTWSVNGSVKWDFICWK